MKTLQMIGLRCKLVCLVLLLSTFSSAYALDSRLSSRENDALTCAGMFYIMTAIGEPKELNEIFTRTTMMMSSIYAKLNFIRTNDSLTNGEISRAKDKAYLRLIELYGKDSEKVINEYIQCNTWRADIAEQFLRVKSPELWLSEIVKNLPIPRKLNNIHLSKVKEEIARRQLSIAMEEMQKLMDYWGTKESLIESLKESLKESIKDTPASSADAGDCFKDKDVADCRVKAEQGYAPAQYYLGLSYALGQGVAQDYKEAAKWTRLAAEQGHAYAQHELGLMYRKGEGVVQDDKQAIKWYRLAAEQGHAIAQYNLGVVYYQGNGVTQDYEQAVKWTRLAAEQGYADAQYNLGVMYQYGEGVAQDYKEAVKWTRLAAEQGHAEAREWMKKHSYAGWTKVSSGDGATFYVDFDRIRKHDGYVYYWRLGDYLKPIMGKYLSDKRYIQGDCKLFREKRLSLSVYTEPMGKGTHSYSDNTLSEKWDYPTPNTILGTTLKSVCSH